MTVNVGTIWHAGHGRTSLAVALTIGLLRNGYASVDMLPSLPTPKPAKRLTAADLERIEAAEAKRQRHLERNKQRGMQE